MSRFKKKEMPAVASSQLFSLERVLASWPEQTQVTMALLQPQILSCRKRGQEPQGSPQRPLTCWILRSPTWLLILAGGVRSSEAGKCPENSGPWHKKAMP